MAFCIIILSLPIQNHTPPPYIGDVRVMVQFHCTKGKTPKKATKGSLHVCVQQARQLNLLHGKGTFVQWLVCHASCSTYHDCVYVLTTSVFKKVVNNKPKARSISQSCYRATKDKTWTGKRLPNEKSLGDHPAFEPGPPPRVLYTRCATTMLN